MNLVVREKIEGSETQSGVNAKPQEIFSREILRGRRILRSRKGEIEDACEDKIIYDKGV